MQSEPAQAVVTRDAPTMYFIGVTTGQSSITRLFPRWAEALGLAGTRGEAENAGAGHPQVPAAVGAGAQLIGVDLPLHAAPEAYRQAVEQVKHDPLSLGALVTTHKIDLLQATEELFDSLDHYALLCQEVSCIFKREGALIGQAKDPLTSRLALEQILGSGYWETSEGEVLCFGAGGSGTAMTVNLLSQPDAGNRPRRLIVTSRNEPALEKLRAIVAQLPSTVDVDYVLNEDPRKNDELLAALPPGSVVINATGMGKDRPGSPITDAGIFPLHAVAWDLNYRGALDFLRQARAQAQSRHLSVQDGWHYFLISWADHIAEVFDRPISTAEFAQLAQLAEIIHNPT
jgi:shikimate dehydrogenase